MTEDGTRAKPSQLGKLFRYSEHWLGIVPAISLLQDAIDQFGPIEQQGKIANASWYVFANNTVKIIILDSQTTIASVRVTADFLEQKSVSKTLQEPLPTTLEEAMNIFGQMEVQENESCTASPVYQRPGVRVACDLGINPQKIRWIEFFII